MNDMDPKALLQEIDEDLARQRAEKLWKQYGPTIITVCVLIVALTAAVTWYKSYKIQTAQKVTASYIDIIKNPSEKPEEYMAALEKFAGESKGKTQATFAKLEEAAFALENGKKDKAVEIYNALAADQSADPVFRQFADLLYVQTELDTGDVATLEARLAPLMKDDAPWRFSAKEYAGYLAIRAGDKEKAKTLFAQLRDGAEVPGSMTARAVDVLNWLGAGSKK